MSNKITNYSFLCFIPISYKHLVADKYTYHKGFGLKSAYIAHMLNELISKYFLTGDYTFTIWSKILQEMYGKHYARYMEYLIDNDIIVLMSNKQVGKTSRKYRLNIRYIRSEPIVRIPFSDMFLDRKIKERKADISFTSLTGSPIPKNIREKLVDDLKTISLDTSSAKLYLDSIREIITNVSYIKNMMSINHIETKDIYYKFDGYGRMHTNYTTLKKHIRKNFIKIDGVTVNEVDIKNSQPFFLGLLMKEFYKEYTDIPYGIKSYIELVCNHLFYEDFIQKSNGNPNQRDKYKDITYKVFFGRNNETVNNKLFRECYPDVFKFIVDYKQRNGSYKSLSHKLQRMESEFIFNRVINEIMILYPHINLFTVHDSIVYPDIYRNEVEGVFYRHLKYISEN